MGIYAKIKAIAKHKFDTLKCQGGVDRKTLQLRAALLPERMATSGVVDLHELEIFLRRSADKKVLNLSETLKYLDHGAKDLDKSHDLAHKHLKQFEERKLPYSLDGILDYACRPEDKDKELTSQERN